MRKISISCVAMLVCVVAQAQTQMLYNEGATFIIESGATLQVNGDVMNKNGTFNNNGTLAINGNFTNNSNLATSGAGTMQLAGTTPQTLSGTFPMATKNLVMSNAAGVTLATPLLVDGVAIFSNGVIHATNSSYPVVFTANGLVSGTPTNASHVNGYVVKQGTGTFTFPLGDAVAYQPVGVNLSANSAGLTALYVPGNAGAAPFGTGGADATPLTQYNTNEYWELTPVGTATGIVTVYYDGYQVTPISLNTADLRVAHKYNGQWLNEGRISGSTGDNISGTIISNVVSNWSPFTFGAISSVILPLQWLSLTGTLNTQKMANLSWNVSEKDVKQYEIEKSTDARNYTTIGSVQSKGTGTHTYAFAEGNILSGTAYYRIRQTDINGHSSFSAIVKLSTLGSDGGISIYPNPVKDAVQVSIPASLLNTEAGLYNAAGQKLQSLLLKNQAFTLNLSSYKAGTYLLLFSNGVTAKIIKQ